MGQSQGSGTTACDWICFSWFFYSFCIIFHWSPPCLSWLRKLQGGCLFGSCEGIIFQHETLNICMTYWCCLRSPKVCDFTLFCEMHCYRWRITDKVFLCVGGPDINCVENKFFRLFCYPVSESQSLLLLGIMNDRFIKVNLHSSLVRSNNRCFLCTWAMPFFWFNK